MRHMYASIAAQYPYPFQGCIQSVNRGNKWVGKGLGPVVYNNQETFSLVYHSSVRSNEVQLTYNYILSNCYVTNVSACGVVYHGLMTLGIALNLLSFSGPCNLFEG